MVHIDENQLSMFLVVAGVAVIPFLARRLRAPSAALEIVYGALLFNFVLDSRPDWFLLLKEIGFIYLMFIAGMELDVRSILKSGKAFWYVAVSLLSFSITPLLFVLLGHSFFLGVAVAMISAGIVVPVLKESKIIKTPLGRDIVGVALTGELLSIIVLTLIDAVHKYGFSRTAGLELIKLVLLFGLALLVLRIVYLLVWWYPERVEKVMESEDPVEEGMRGVVTIVFAGGLLAAAAGVEPILGSFLAGMVFSYTFRSKGRFEEKLNALGFGFLIPFFFVGIGSSMEVGLLASPENIIFALFLTVMVFVSNIYPIVLSRPLGISMKDACSMSLLLSSPLSMIVVAGTLGEKMGFLSLEMNEVLILTALTAGIVYPLLFRFITKKL